VTSGNHSLTRTPTDHRHSLHHRRSRPHITRRHQPSPTSATRKPTDSSLRHSQRHSHPHITRLHHRRSRPHITRRHQPSPTSATLEPRDSCAANVGSTHSTPPTPHPRTPSTPPASASRNLKPAHASSSPLLTTNRQPVRNVEPLLPPTLSLQ
jgi:hypothetical protein